MKNIASERAGKKRGEIEKEDPSLPSFFPALSLAIFFTRAALSERLEQARFISTLFLYSFYNQCNVKVACVDLMRVARGDGVAE